MSSTTTETKTFTTENGTVEMRTDVEVLTLASGATVTTTEVWMRMSTQEDWVRFLRTVD